MKHENLKKSLINKGFKPVKKRNDCSILKGPDGIVIWHRDGNLEGFISDQLSDSLTEIKLRHVIEGLSIIGISITYFTTDITLVNGQSMEPTYKNGKLIIKSKAVKNVEKILISNGAIVKFHAPTGERNLKRVVAVPGDEIILKGTEIYVNGKLIDSANHSRFRKKQQALSNKTGTDKGSELWSEEKIKLKPNEFYVIGDNRENSTDSRDYGPIHKTNIISIIGK